MSWLESLLKKHQKKKKTHTNNKSLINTLIFEPYKFSLLKALDLSNIYSDTVIIKNNLSFSSKYSTIQKVEGVKDGYIELHINFPSIIGINGTLPDIYVEKYLLYNLYTKDAVKNFFDIFHRCGVNAFYKISKQYNPISCKSSIIKILLQLSGYGSIDEFHEAINSTNIPIQLPISTHNLFWNENRSAYGLKLLLSHFFNVNIEVHEFCETLIELPIDEQTRIGTNHGRYNVLGISSILDRFSWDTTSKIMVLVGPLPLEQYIQFLPKMAKNDRRFSLLQRIEELIKLYVPFNITVSLKIMLDTSIVNGTLLNRSKALNKDAFLFGKIKNIQFTRNL